MTALLSSAATRSNHFNAGDRPTPAGPGVIEIAPKRTLRRARPLRAGKSLQCVGAAFSRRIPRSKSEPDGRTSRLQVRRTPQGNILHLTPGCAPRRQPCTSDRRSPDSTVEREVPGRVRTSRLRDPGDPHSRAGGFWGGDPAAGARDGGSPLRAVRATGAGEGVGKRARGFVIELPPHRRSRIYLGVIFVILLPCTPSPAISPFWPKMKA
jgi:hypothetical protein